MSDSLGVKSGRATSVAAATEITITGLPINKVIAIRRIKLVKVSGDAATFTPVLGTVTNPGGTINQIAAGTSAAGWEVTNTFIVCRTDSLGQIYLRPVPNTGTNTVVDWLIGFSV